MIVRCKNCNSAFAVDDEKVSGKKFAFSCLKCGTENIVDNRISTKAEDSKLESLPDMKPHFSDDKTPDESILENSAAISSDDDIFTDNIDFDSITEPESNEAVDADLFTDDEILSFQDEDEMEIRVGDEIDESEILFDDIEGNDLTEKGKDEPKLNRQEDIDELFAIIPDSNKKSTDDENSPLDLDSINLEFEDTDSDRSNFHDDAEDKLIVTENDISPEDEIDIDLAELDIDMEESDDIIEEANSADGISLDFDEEETSPESKEDFSALEDEDISLDLDSLDLDLEETPVNDEQTVSEKEDASEDDLSLDPDSLDIDLDEDDLDIKFDETTSNKSSEIDFDSDEDLTLNLDDLDIDLDEEVLQEIDDQPSLNETDDDDENLTLNLDELDIDLDDVPYSDERSVTPDKDLSNPDDEDLTLNLNELDIELEDDVIKASLEKINGHIHDDPSHYEDESITIDLDTLDLDFEEDAASADLSNLEDEEKITIDDAGITFDELTRKESPAASTETDDDIRFSIDEVDPDSELHDIMDDSTDDEISVIDTLDELPEIDLDEYENFLTRDETVKKGKVAFADETEFNFDDIEIIPIDDDFDLYAPEDDFSDASIPARGTTALSIDFSLKYSRLGALLRLTGLYIISLVPHFIVLLLYVVISAVLGFINQVVILFTGHCLEDFSQITENTLRYLISIKTNIIGIVEDRPEFSGKESLSHQVQMNITYPVKYSKNIALLRLSIVGILLFTLPHLVILAILTLAVPFAFIAGLIIVIATGRWPGTLFTYLTKYFRYLTKLLAFTIGLNDEYPPFRLE